MSSKKYFKEVAQEWDTMRKGFFSEAVRKKVICKAEVTSGKTAVDLGAGTGFISEILLKKGLKVTAVDQSKEMLNILKSKIGTLGEIECKVGISDNLPINEYSTDYVFANLYLHHVESPLKALQEAYRILKHNGKILITDLDEHNNEFLRKEHHDRWLGFKRSEIKSWFVDAGFEKVQIISIDEQCCAKSECSESKADVSIFLAYGEKI